MDPKQAYLAMCAFLEELWERTRQPGELGNFCGMVTYIPGHGSADPGMWFDWLASVKQLQTGELVPFGAGRRGSLTADLLSPLNAEQAYLAMFAFIEEYWLRVNRPAELGDLLNRLRYTPGAASADPSLWKDWLTTVQRILSNPITP